jgi:hypothetical protein
MSYWNQSPQRTLAEMEYGFMIHACMDRAFAKQKAEQAKQAAEQFKVEFNASAHLAFTALSQESPWEVFADIQFAPYLPSVSTISLIMTTSAMLALNFLDMPAVIGTTTIVAASIILKK